VILFIAIAFGIGLATITALGLVLRAEEVSRLLGAPAVPLWSAAAVILALAIVFLSFCAVRRKPLRVGPVELIPPGAHLVLTQIGSSSRERNYPRQGNGRVFRRCPRSSLNRRFDSTT
jgi:uncharacterized membrane protein YbhN (UPF0104 family)